MNQGNHPTVHRKEYFLNLDHNFTTHSFIVLLIGKTTQGKHKKRFSAKGWQVREIGRIKLIAVMLDILTDVTTISCKQFSMELKEMYDPTMLKNPKTGIELYTGGINE